VVALGVTVHEKDAVVVVVEESGPAVNVTTGAVRPLGAFTAAVALSVVAELVAMSELGVVVALCIVVALVVVASGVDWWADAPCWWSRAWPLLEDVASWTGRAADAGAREPNIGTTRAADSPATAIGTASAVRERREAKEGMGRPRRRRDRSPQPENRPI
jgi:hypothetical protein